MAWQTDERTWTGRGASLALAELIATVARAARCVEPEDAQGRVAWVSRSGTAQGPFDLLVTETPGPGPRWVVAAPEEPPDTWFPLSWQRAVAGALARSLGADLPDLAGPTAPGLLIVPAGARPIATLLNAVDHKFGLRPWRVCTPGEFEHGAFARVHAERLPIHVLGDAPQVVAWARDQVPVEQTTLPEALPAALSAYQWVLAGLADRLPSTRPISRAHDPRYAGVL